MGVLFSGKYNTFGSKLSQRDIAAELEASGIANHNLAGYAISIFALNSTSWVAGGGIDRLKSGVSAVKNIFAINSKNDVNNDDYFSGGRRQELAEDNLDVEESKNIMQEFKNYLARYRNARSGAEKSVCANALKGYFKLYLEKGGNNPTLIQAYKDLEPDIDLDIATTGENLKDYDFFGFAMK